MTKHVRRSSFTLMEMVVVIIIIALLASIVGPNLYKKMTQASASTTKAQIKTLSNAVLDYRLDTGKLIDGGSGLEELIRNVSGSEKWDGPYLNTKKLPKDGWGNEFIYSAPGQSSEYDIISYGADGQPGGEKENADLSNWD